MTPCIQAQKMIGEMCSLINAVYKDIYNGENNPIYLKRIEYLVSDIRTSKSEPISRNDIKKWIEQGIDGEATLETNDLYFLNN